MMPVHVIAGPLGVGKTTVLSYLLANKPPEQNWVVLMNEFSEAGIDALTVASAARGAYDVRLIAGGCLHCSGEQDFQRTLGELIDRVQPDRVLVEPSGIGHPAGIVDGLLGFEARGDIRLEGVVALIDPVRLLAGEAERPGTLRDGLEIADAVALTRAASASPAELHAFEVLVATMVPAKRWHGAIEAGALPLAALQAGVGESRRERGLPGHAHWATTSEASVGEAIATIGGERINASHIDFTGASWRFPRAIEFIGEALQLALGGLYAGNSATLAPPLRLKVVLRVAEDRWLLWQHDGTRSEVRESSWRRDSRIEVIHSPGTRVDWRHWDQFWSQCQARPA